MIGPQVINRPYTAPAQEGVTLTLTFILGDKQELVVGEQDFLPLYSLPGTGEKCLPLARLQLSPWDTSGHS